MAKHKRKPVSSPPVTSHPLFPAVVALWFGALFGLGSLAVRPSLIEALVIKSRIDLIIPATAPPLGVTARILIALLLAVLGAALGIMLARRLARPKVTEVERKRSAKDLSTANMRFRARDAHPDAPARAPISAHEELGSADLAPAVMAMRRRALSIEESPRDFVPHDLAPLPGAAAQVLDIAELALAEPEVHYTPELGTYGEPATSLAQPNAAPLDWSVPAPALAPATPPVMPAALDNAAALAAGCQVFGMTPQPERAEAPRQIFGAAINDGHVSADFVKAAGYQTTVFDGPEASPLFAPRTADAAAEPLATGITPDLTAPAANAEAAPRLSPANLGMTDLATRLAEAMRRRRAEAASRQSELAPEPRQAEPAAAPEPLTATAEPAPPAAIPVAYEPATGPAELQPLPSAMRPLALDAFLEEDAALDASLLPPRHFAMPSPALVAAPGPSEPVAAPVRDDEQGAADTEENYGSLLGLAPARSGFVRIDDPEADQFADEPVVIFPGQASRRLDQAPRPLEPAPALTAAVATEGHGSFRRFDAPSSAGQGQPLAAANNAMPAVDPVEAERALRAALSNLQRMSGAA